MSRARCCKDAAVCSPLAAPQRPVVHSLGRALRLAHVLAGDSRSDAFAVTLFAGRVGYAPCRRAGLEVSSGMGVIVHHRFQAAVCDVCDLMGRRLGPGRPSTVTGVAKGGEPLTSVGNTPPRRPPPTTWPGHPRVGARTTTECASPSPVPEHPRDGGEDPRGVHQTVDLSGTPPRRREGPQATGVVAVVPRNTLASAGRTESGSAASPIRSEHPCVGGEDASCGTVFSENDGTPPRRRGGPEKAVQVLHQLRNTPARRRGGRVGGDGAEPDRRHTPASAGMTDDPARRWRRRAEHPRVGGEDADDAEPGETVTGTPPRRRGGPPPPGQVEVRERNTPASAGRTDCTAAPP